MIGLGVLLLLVGLPLVAAALSYVVGPRAPRRALGLSMVFAVGLTVAASLAVVDVELQLLSGRSLLMSPVAQFGIQLLSLALLGLVMSLTRAPDEIVVHWLPVAWLSVSGLTLSLLMASLPLALLAFVSAALVWAFGLPPDDRAEASGAVLRFAALLALAMPLLLLALRLAEGRTSSTPDLESLVLALAVPAFALYLGLIPMHAWTLTLASGAPRSMLFGVLGLVQTAGFVLLLRTLEEYPWITEVAGTPLIVGGALSAVVGGWLALSSRLEDPDDWLVYVMIASSGIMLAALGTQSRAAAIGMLLLLFARTLALLTLSLAPRVEGATRRLAYAAATLTVAGTPGLAGFPGTWLVLRMLGALGSAVAVVALLAGSGMMFGTALRRWHAPPEPATDLVVGEGEARPDAGARWAVLVLIGLLVLFGLLPQLLVPAFERALRGLFFPLS